MHDPLCEAILHRLRNIDGLGLNLEGGVRSFSDMGADSTAMMMVSLEFEEELGTELPPHLLWDCPDVDRLADFLLENVEETRLSEFVRG
jgi:hypothetical protein